MSDDGEQKARGVMRAARGGLFYRHTCERCGKMEEGPVEPGRIVVDPPKGWVTMLQHDGTQSGYARFVFCSIGCMVRGVGLS